MCQMLVSVVQLPFIRRFVDANAIARHGTIDRAVAGHAWRAD